MKCSENEEILKPQNNAAEKTIIAAEKFGFNSRKPALKTLAKTANSGCLTAEEACAALS